MFSLLSSLRRSSILYYCTRYRLYVKIPYVTTISCDELLTAAIIHAACCVIAGGWNAAMVCPLLLVTAALILVYTLGAGFLLRDFHAKRQLFHYRSRSPAFALCSGVANVVLVDIALVHTLTSTVPHFSVPSELLLWANWLALVSCPGIGDGS